MQKLESPLQLSKQFVLINLIMLVGSLWILCYAPTYWIIKLFLITTCIFYSVYILYRQKQWQSIRFDEKGWWLQNADGVCNIEIAGDSTVTAYVTVLRFSIPGKRFKQACVIFKDAMHADAYRQMVVRLRYF